MNSTRVYHTKQKDIILELLQKNHDNHMTAEQMLSTLKDEHTPVSKATLYRFLDCMVENGEVKKFNLDNSASCYQYVGEHNDQCTYHLKCNSCGKVFHVDDTVINKMNSKIEKNCDFKIDKDRTVFYGICGSCNKNEE